MSFEFWCWFLGSICVACMGYCIHLFIWLVRHPEAFRHRGSGGDYHNFPPILP